MECKFCTREINNAGSLIKHQNSCKFNPKKIYYPRSKNAGLKKGNIPWNKGLTKKDRPSLARPNRQGKLFGKALTGHSEKSKKHLSEIAKMRNFGGYVRGSGRGKKGWYKGFFCDSSWELAFVIYCLENNKKIKRNTEKRKYIWQGLEKNYIPDFIVDGDIIEIKGWKTPQWEAKKKFNPDIKVLYEGDLQHVLNYVVNKYGKDFIKLYRK